MIIKRKVGLALSGGGARGLAHIGVLEVLQKEAIPIHYIAGTSIGAIIGSIFALTGDAAFIKQQALEVDRRTLAALTDLTFARSGLVGGKRIKERLQKIIGADTRFEDLKMPFACVATDIYTLEEIVIKEGLVLDAVRASISIPVIFSAARFRGRYLVDGGLVNPIPVTVAKEMGTDFVIAVNVIPDIKERASFIKAGGGKGPRPPSIFNVMIQTMYIGSYMMVKNSQAQADAVILPRVAHIGYMEFFRAGEAIRQGELAAQEALPDIKKLLEIG